MIEPTIIIINGLPATGKTTIAHKIGERLKLPVFTKDDFKELIADSIGVKDQTFKGLGTASNLALFYIAKQCI